MELQPIDPANTDLYLAMDAVIGLYLQESATGRADSYFIGNRAEEQLLRDEWDTTVTVRP